MPSCVTVKHLQLSGICGDAYVTCTYNGLNNVLCFAMFICVVVCLCSTNDRSSVNYIPPTAHGWLYQHSMRKCITRAADGWHYLPAKRTLLELADDARPF